MGDFSFPKHLHLRRPAEFSRVYGSGMKKHSRGFVVFRLGNELGHPRLGLSVSRRFGNAVRRNRIKRIIREVFRLNWKKWDLEGVDIVVISKRGADSFRFQEATVDMAKALAPRGRGR